QHNVPGLHLAPLQDYFYASNNSLDYFLFVMPNTSSIQVTVTPQLTHTLCNPVLLCNGHGSCDAKRLDQSCDCIQGLGYGFTGEYCNTSVETFDWFWTVCGVTVL